jgi:translocation and assembly module TamA
MSREMMTQPTAISGRNRLHLSGLLEQTAAMVAKLGTEFDHYRCKLNELNSRYAEGRFHLAVLGQVKRGKNTLLNALIGESILPTGVVPLTAAPPFIRYAETPKTIMQYECGQVTDEFSGASTEERSAYLKKFVTQEGNPQNRLPITEVELEFLRQVLEKVPQLFFGMNKIDYLDGRELEPALSFYKRVFSEHTEWDGEIHVFCVSARKGLDARTDKDLQSWTSSGLEQLESFRRRPIAPTHEGTQVSMTHPEQSRRSRSRPESWPLILFGALLVALALFSPAKADEKPRLKVQGGTEEQRHNIEAFVSMRRYECELPAFRERGIIRSTEDRALQALRALGHYQPEIGATITRTATCWDLMVTVEPGPVVRIVEVDVRVEGDGAEDPFFVAIVSDPGVAPDDPLRHDAHDRLRSRLVGGAADQGYFDAELTKSRLLVDPEANEARITLWMNTGRRYRFGEITLEQDILHKEFVARLFPFQRGDPYSSVQVIQLQRNLNDSGYFQGVRVRPAQDDRMAGEVPILAEVEPRQRTAYEMRLGFTTDIGPRLGLALDRRYATQWGHHYEAELELSDKRSGVGFSYDIPLRDPLNDSLALFATYRTEDTRTSESERFQIGASRVQRHPSGWRTTQGIRYEYEDFTVGEVDDISRLLIPSYRISRTKADDPLYPRNGYRVDMLGQGALDNLGSTISLLQGRANAKLIHGLGTGRLILRGEAGATAGAGVEELPSSLRFFAGGDTSVRGFGFQQLGPVDDVGNLIGGRYLLVGSVEYDHPIGGGKWSVAIFIDLGNAFNDFNEYELKGGGGVGLRWRSPVGPLRLDLAHAPDSNDNFRIHFTMGPDL